MYTSPTVQNELIQLIGRNIQDKIIDRIKEAVFFSLLSDETTDISKVEQFSLSLILSYVREDFIEFVPVYDVTGCALAHQ